LGAVSSVSRAARRSTRRVAKVDGVPSSERADKVGGRRAETQRAGLICVKSFGLRFGRTTGTTIAEPLDHTANSHRQNGHA
ncbi:MAG: hypothetical protein ABWY13_05305, partial [Mesorhizobium sp.]